MADFKLPIIIAYLEKTQITLLAQKEKVGATFVLPPEMVSDLEVRRMEDLASDFKNFLDQSKIAPGHVYIILSADLLFIKDFTVTTEDAARAEMEKFIKSVPFERVGNREYRMGKIQKVVASNREFYETFQSVLESQGFIVVAVTPISALPEVANSGFNLETAKRLFGKTEVLRQNSFIHQEEAREEELQKGADPRKNKKLLALLLVFGGLLTVLGIMAGKLLFEDKHTTPPPAVTTAPVTQKPAPAPIALPTSTASASGINVAEARVQVTNSSGRAGLAAVTRQQLEAIGFKTIDTGNGPIINGAKHIIAFSTDVSAQTREQVVTALAKNLGEFTIQQVSEPKYNVVITLTNSQTASNSGSQLTP